MSSDGKCVAHRAIPKPCSYSGGAFRVRVQLLSNAEGRLNAREWWAEPMRNLHQMAKVSSAMPDLFRYTVEQLVNSNGEVEPGYSWIVEA